MTIEVAFLGVPVANYNEALVWYERLMGRPPDMIPNDIEAAWQLSEQGWLYVIQDTSRAGKALLTLIVDDLDRHIAEIEGRGIATDSIETTPGVYRKAVIADPEGNMINFAELTDGES